MRQPLRPTKLMPGRVFAGAYSPHLPGTTVSWLAAANSCSPSTIRRARRDGEAEAEAAAARRFLAELTAERGLAMALIRPKRGLLPLWSRMAIAEFAGRGASYSELMALFQVSRSTVYRSIHRSTTSYNQLSGKRLVTSSQTTVANSARKPVQTP
jgi:hypothetical protein